MVRQLCEQQNLSRCTDQNSVSTRMKLSPTVMNPQAGQTHPTADILVQFLKCYTADTEVQLMKFLQACLIDVLTRPYMPLHALTCPLHALYMPMTCPLHALACPYMPPYNLPCCTEPCLPYARQSELPCAESLWTHAVCHWTLHHCRCQPLCHC